MKKLIKIALIFTLFIASGKVVSQVTVTTESVYLNNQSTIIGCNLLDFGSTVNNSLVVYFKLLKPAAQAIGDSNVKVMFMNSSSSNPVQIGGTFIAQSGAWSSNTTIQSSIIVSIPENTIQVTGSFIYVECTTDSNLKTKSCDSPLKKTPPPSFTLSPTSTIFACDDTSARTFTVTPANIPSGSTLTYQWSYSGWSGTVNSSMNSINLTPSSGTSLPSTVSVTPYIGGVAYPSKTCTVSRSSFSSLATINGSSSICNLTEIYSIANLATGQNLTWSSSNTAIATVSNTTGNTVTVNKVGTGDFDLIATISNSCGQSITVKNPIIAYAVTSIPTPSGYFDVDFVDCYYDTALPINFYPDTPFGGVITLTPSVLPHPMQSQTKNITVKYTNPCTGEYTSKVITFYYQAPDCSSAKMSNNISLYNIYPNPSNDIVNIDLKDQKNQPTKGVTIFGELFDMMGQSKSKVQISDKKATFSVRGLKKGIYVLKIHINDQVESHQIAVE
ncbi:MULTISPECIES: T9SS type A sorting domain-containing protein [unclassified Flavobacterium]|uniref:T9SS type A sorting domain-containing protein n=1 Tax=unclassified Flavobacterium TaxID=196869 RepID=UPI0025C48577|nr:MULTISPECIES: T9SS type A sorting domain-containing protein [unclassified Flavobacterium]